jgi:hypothetical protein
MIKRFRTPPADPLTYFIHGQRFYACDCALMHEGFDQEVKDFTVYGAAVMSALASELFLKCLGVIESGRVSRTHNLNTLFKNLSPKTRTLIERRRDEILAGKKHLIDELEQETGTPISRRLTDALHVGANSFESLRYPELSPQANFFLTDLPHALLLAILELKPEWQRELAIHVPLPAPDSKWTGAIIRAPDNRAQVGKLEPPRCSCFQPS